jgi:glucose-6-phosphate isomerase
MEKISVNINNISNFVSQEQIHGLQEPIAKSHEMTLNKTGKGNDFLGWIDLPSEIDNALLNDIEITAKKLAEISDIFLVEGNWR